MKRDSGRELERDTLAACGRVGPVAVLRGDPANWVSTAEVRVGVSATENGVPQLPQKRLPSGISAEQESQRIGPSRWQRSGAM